MEFVRGLHNLRPAHRGSVVTIGNFDGVHLGHQAILGRLVARAQEYRLPAVVLSFEPNPREFFDPANAPGRLMRLRDKLPALAAAGVDRLVLLHFNEELRAWSGREFIERVLYGALGARHVIIGSGFRYGRGRSGTVELLRDEGVLRGFGVDEVPPFEQDGERVSSTRVREALACGDLALAHRLLGRDYRMSGRVIDGRRLGRTLGYPTANVRLHRRKSPVHGVFAVRVAGLADGLLPGVASLGTRPTLGGGELLLEVHLFDFDGDLYGRYIGVDFVAKIRDEARFPDLDSLVTQMHDDASRARAVL
jgi:riboflavin kinase/FMN adenylyltransferase